MDNYSSEKLNFMENKLAISKKYLVIQTENKTEWDNLVTNSVNPSLYSYSKYLDYSESKYQLILIKKGQDTFAGVPVLISEDEKNIISNKNILYTPILYSKIVFENKSQGSINNEIYNIIYTVYFFLIENYKNIEITFDYFSHDIRPFVWHNFYNKGENFEIFPRYTSILSHNGKHNEYFQESMLFKNFNTTKRKEYRRSLKLNYKITNKIKKEDFANIMTDTFKRQNIKKENVQYSKLYDLLSYFENQEMLRVYSVLDSKSDILNFLFLSTLSNKSCFLFSGRSSINDESNAGTFLYCEIFKDLIKKNINIFDLEGINSPKRAFNKISYGGRVMPYYQLVLKRQ